MVTFQFVIHLPSSFSFSDQGDHLFSKPESYGFPAEGFLGDADIIIHHFWEWVGHWILRHKEAKYILSPAKRKQL